jgi:hypothetical protein
MSTATMDARADLGPGVYDGIPNDVYHGVLEAVGSTTLKGLLDPNMVGLYDARGRVDLGHKTAFDVGTAAHSLILESDTDGVTVLPYKDWRTKAAQADRDAAREAGLIPMLAHEWAPVPAMRDAVLAHPVAKTLVTGHVAEQTIITRDEQTGVLVKVRPDARTAVIADLKTVADANPRTIERKVIPERGYHQSGALYVDTVNAELGEELPFVLICVEKTAPYRVSVVEIGDDYLADGRARNRRALDLYAHGIQTGEWPTWPDTYTAEPPLWLTTQTEELTEGA